MDTNSLTPDSFKNISIIKIQTKKIKGFQEDLSRLKLELATEQKTIRDLRNFIDVMKIGWSSDKKKLNKTIEELSESENKIVQTEKLNQDKIDKLTYELVGERKTIVELRNFIDVMKTGWSIDRSKLMEITTKLNVKELPIKEEKVLFGTKDDSLKNNKKRKITVISKLKKIKHEVEVNADTINDPLKACDPLRNQEHGTVSCPLCCKEKFSNQDDLKYHLQSVLDHVFCPVCKRKHDNILALTNHLITGCNSSPEPDIKYVPDIILPKVQINTKVEAPYTLTDTDLIKQEKDDPLFMESCEEYTASKLYACSQCSMFFLTVDEAQRHGSVHEAEFNTVKCDQCLCVSNKTVDLNNHVKHDHSTDSAQSCSEPVQSNVSAKNKTQELATTSSKLRALLSNNRIDLSDRTNTHLPEANESLPRKETKIVKIYRSGRKRKLNQIYYDDSFVN